MLPPCAGLVMVALSAFKVVSVLKMPCNRIGNKLAFSGKGGMSEKENLEEEKEQEKKGHTRTSMQTDWYERNIIFSAT